MTKDQLLKIRVNPTDTKKEDQRNGMNSASTDLGHVWRSVAREVHKKLFLENYSQIVLKMNTIGPS